MRGPRARLGQCGRCRVCVPDEPELVCPDLRNGGRIWITALTKNGYVARLGADHLSRRWRQLYPHTQNGLLIIRPTKPDDQAPRAEGDAMSHDRRPMIMTLDIASRPL